MFWERNYSLRLIWFYFETSKIQSYIISCFDKLRESRLLEFSVQSIDVGVEPCLKPFIGDFYNSTILISRCPQLSKPLYAPIAFLAAKSVMVMGSDVSTKKTIGENRVNEHTDVGGGIWLTKDRIKLLWCQLLRGSFFPHRIRHYYERQKGCVGKEKKHIRPWAVNALVARRPPASAWSPIPPRSPDLIKPEISAALFRWWY